MRIEFQTIIKGAETLLSFMEGNIPSVVRIQNLHYIVVPRALRFFDFYKFALKSVPDSNVITIEDFNTYDIVKVDKSQMIISSDTKKILNIDLFTAYDGSKLLGSLTDNPGAVISYYNRLSKFLPYDFNNKDYVFWLIKYSHEVIPTSTAILTFLYTLYHLENVKITSYTDGDEKAVEYITRLKEKLGTIGKDFDKAIENLGILGVLL